MGRKDGGASSMNYSASLRSRRVGITVLVLTALVAACENQTVAPPLNEARRPRSLVLEDSSAKLLTCPTNETESASALVTPLGGSVALGGHRVDIPIGAVQLPVLITLTEPASPIMEISLRVAGVDFFEFVLPVRVTISYERCSRSNIDRASLQAWYIDDGTKALLQNMGGFDDKLARTVTFRTGHFSGYALAQ
jgi:hypothetical protein